MKFALLCMNRLKIECRKFSYTLHLDIRFYHIKDLLRSLDTFILDSCRPYITERQRLFVNCFSYPLNVFRYMNQTDTFKDFSNVLSNTKIIKCP